MRVGVTVFTVAGGMRSLVGDTAVSQTCRPTLLTPTHRDKAQTELWHEDSKLSMFELRRLRSFETGCEPATASRLERLLLSIAMLADLTLRIVERVPGAWESTHRAHWSAFG